MHYHQVTTHFSETCRNENNVFLKMLFYMYFNKFCYFDMVDAILELNVIKQDIFKSYLEQV